MRYHWLYALSFLTATPLADFATPLTPWGDVRVKHAWSSVPANWETLGCPSAGTTIDLYIALSPHHENALIDALYEVSDPRHPRHVHLATAPLTPSFTSPNWSSRTQTRLSLSHPGSHITACGPPRSQRHSGAWLTVSNVLVSQANKMLGASYQLCRHAKVNDTIIRTVSYALPEVLHSHIQAVAPTTYFASTRTPRQTSRRRSVGAAAALAEAEATSGKPVTVLPSRADGVMPSQLRWMYKTLAICVHRGWPEYARDIWLPGTVPDLATFTVEQVNGGGYDPDNPGDEANLDVQYASAMAYPTPIIFYSIGGSGKWVTRSGEPYSGDWWLESLDYLLKKTHIPQTISISYGAYERYVPREYARALCILFAQLGAGGVSVILSTGDDGVGKNCKDEFGNVRFANSFPATCPYLTAVGGTTDYDPEDVAVSAFLERQGTKYASFYNPEGRGIPDIAAQALMLPVIVRNDGVIVDGTSRSAPSQASLLNDYFITNGRPPLGFLNIRLYHDGIAASTTSHLALTSAAAPMDSLPSLDGIPFVPPDVTGLGTPDFEKLQNIFMIPLGGGIGQVNLSKIREPGESQR
ncbi:subtilisin-like protein [Lactarius hatsudake]|nr:subtilisin-like protein [Lactarius hatsudake]